MSGPVRAFVKRVVPIRAKQFLFGLRAVAGNPPIDEVVVADWQFATDPCVGRRLNLVIPNLAASSAFGGVVTGLDIFLQLAKQLRETVPLAIRVIYSDPDRETDSSIFLKAAEKAGLGKARLSFLSVTRSNQTIPVRQRDLFVTYNWWTTLNTQALLDAQARHYGQPVAPLVYLIQEYEPHMMPFSSAHMLAREAYDTPPRLWGVFNSSNLHDYFRLLGHGTERAFVFEPVINERLRSYLDQVATSQRTKRILVYGRPAIPRNCFPALIRGLRHWVETDPCAADWEIVSAGMAHRPIPLGKGQKVVSVGKLSLDDYARMLLSSSVGVSLQASPHPSYPPLEMAHMGVRTITNAYTSKDLTGFHPNLISVRSITAGGLSAALTQACSMWGAAPDTYADPGYVRTQTYPFLSDLAAELIAEFPPG